MTKQIVGIEGEAAAPEAVRPVIALIETPARAFEWQYADAVDPASAAAAIES